MSKEYIYTRESQQFAQNGGEDIVTDDVMWHNTLYTSFLLTCAKWGSVNWTRDSFLKSWGKCTIHTTWDMTWQGFFTESGLKFIHAPLTLQHQGILALEVMTADWSQTSYGWSRRPGWNRPPRRRSRPLLRRRGMLSESERRMNGIEESSLESVTWPWKGDELDSWSSGVSNIISTTWLG